MIESTFAIIKPEAISQKLTGKIISMIEDSGLFITKMELIKADVDIIREHYHKENPWFNIVGQKVLDAFISEGLDPFDEIGTNNPNKAGRQLVEWVVSHMTSSEIIIMEISGSDAVNSFRRLCGATSPAEAGHDTIRGQLSDDDNKKAVLKKRPLLNLIHSSGNEEEAKFELNLWFSK